VEFGDYGYRHFELHKSGTIDELLERTGKTCCDGGMGGECRVTQIRFGSLGKWEAYLDGRWCPVDAEIRYDVQLPSDVTAIVCAARSALDKSDQGCPSTYCAATAPGT
jgi:hypothetical protein